MASDQDAQELVNSLVIEIGNVDVLLTFYYLACLPPGFVSHEASACGESPLVRAVGEQPSTSTEEHAAHNSRCQKLIVYLLLLLGADINLVGETSGVSAQDRASQDGRKEIENVLDGFTLEQQDGEPNELQVARYLMTLTAEEVEAYIVDGHPEYGLYGDALPPPPPPQGGEDVDMEDSMDEEEEEDDKKDDAELAAALLRDRAPPGSMDGVEIKREEMEDMKTSTDGRKLSTSSVIDSPLAPPVSGKAPSLPLRLHSSPNRAQSPVEQDEKTIVNSASLPEKPRGSLMDGQALKAASLVNTTSIPDPPAFGRRSSDSQRFDKNTIEINNLNRNTKGQHIRDIIIKDGVPPQLIIDLALRSEEGNKSKRYYALVEFVANVDLDTVIGKLDKSVIEGSVVQVCQHLPTPAPVAKAASKPLPPQGSLFAHASGGLVPSNTSFDQDVHWRIDRRMFQLFIRHLPPVGDDVVQDIGRFIASVVPHKDILDIKLLGGRGGPKHAALIRIDPRHDPVSVVSKLDGTKWPNFYWNVQVNVGWDPTEVVSTPRQKVPTVPATLSLPWHAECVVVVGNIAYKSHDDAERQVLDVIGGENVVRPVGFRQASQLNRGKIAFVELRNTAECDRAIEKLNTSSSMRATRYLSDVWEDESAELDGFTTVLCSTNLPSTTTTIEIRRILAGALSPEDIGPIPLFTTRNGTTVTFPRTATHISAQRLLEILHTYVPDSKSKLEVYRGNGRTGTSDDHPRHIANPFGTPFIEERRPMLAIPRRDDVARSTPPSTARRASSPRRSMRSRSRSPAARRDSLVSCLDRRRPSSPPPARRRWRSPRSRRSYSKSRSSSPSRTSRPRKRSRSRLRSRSVTPPVSRGAPRRSVTPKGRLVSNNDINGQPVTDPPSKTNGSLEAKTTTAIDAVKTEIDIKRLKSFNYSNSDIASIQRIWQPLIQPPTLDFTRRIDFSTTFGYLTPEVAKIALSANSPFSDDSKAQIRYEAFLSSQIGDSKDHYTTWFAVMAEFNARNEEMMRVANGVAADVKAKAKARNESERKPYDPQEKVQRIRFDKRLSPGQKSRRKENYVFSKRLIKA